MKKSDYRPVVGLNNIDNNFRGTKLPVNLVTVSFDTPYKVKRLDYEVFNDETGKLKFFLPPGTVAFNANLYYFYVQEDGKVVLRLNDLPVTSLDKITSTDTAVSIDERVLKSLVEGREVLNYSPGLPANSLPISSPNLLIEPMQTGGYVYGDYKYPGGILQRGLIQVFVKADMYEQWFNSPSTKWDDKNNPDENSLHSAGGIVQTPTVPAKSLEEIAIERANQSGLTDALRRLGKTKNDTELINEVLSTGVWAALLEFMQLSAK